MGVYTFTLDGGRQVQARFRFTYKKIDGKWLITEHHSSAMPENFVGEVLAAFSAWNAALQTRDPEKASCWGGMLRKEVQRRAAPALCMLSLLLAYCLSPSSFGIAMMDQSLATHFSPITPPAAPCCAPPRRSLTCTPLALCWCPR
jgi:hypothetical protein